MPEVLRSFGISESIDAVDVVEGGWSHQVWRVATRERAGGACGASGPNEREPYPNASRR